MKLYRYIALGYDAEITKMYDMYGIETDNPDLAVKIVAKQGEAMWIAAEAERHEIVEAHHN
jgi:hypothetical protein